MAKPLRLPVADVRAACDNTSDDVYCEFMKRGNDEIRHMTFRLPHKAGCHPVPANRLQEDDVNKLLTVFDIDEGEYRRVDLATVYMIMIGGKRYIIDNR